MLTLLYLPFAADVEDYVVVIVALFDVDEQQELAGCKEDYRRQNKRSFAKHMTGIHI